MTRDEIMSADCTTLNMLAATEIMGWRLGRWAGIEGYRDSRNNWLGALRFPCSNYNDAAKCRRKIEERGLLTAFALELAAIVFGWKPWRMEGTAERSFTNMQVGDLLNATPDQITRACLLAVCKE